ncbi:MAG: ROK family protein [Bdellovibrionales bacterium]|nr:ROK family protein [Bdellovibrionales bacterium]
MSIYLLGADVGGTKTEVCLLELADGKAGASSGAVDLTQYKVIARERMSTDKARGLEDFGDRLKNLFEGILSKSNMKMAQIKSIGLGLPGSIDPLSQRQNAGSITFFNGFNLAQYFSKKLGYSGTIYLDNDANCFALAETYLGAGARWARAAKVPLDQLCMVGITLGTGLGGGLIVNGQLIRGRRGGAGELGHTTLIESGRPCYCGKFGCSEQYLSGPAFEQSYAMRASASSPKKGSEIFKLADQGDPLAIATIEYYRDHLVQFLSNVSNFMDPHIIVLGGGMSTQKRIYTGISDRLSSECFLTENPPDVIPNECGDSAGVLGAALLGYWT